MLNAIVWMIVIAIISYGSTFTVSTKEVIVGITVNLNLVIFYASPLSVIGTVVQKRNSSYIHIPTMITHTLNGCFWAAYGIAVFDLYIAIPNGLGATLGIIQMILCYIFPRTNNNNNINDIGNVSDNNKQNCEPSEMLAETVPATSTNDLHFMVDDTHP